LYHILTVIFIAPNSVFIDTWLALGLFALMEVNMVGMTVISEVES